MKIFDGHNDVLLRLRGNNESFFDRSPEGHLDFPRAREGGLAGGIFAIFVRSHRADNGTAPVTPPTPDAANTALSLMAQLFRIEAESAGRFTVALTARDIEDAFARDSFAATMHIEGAEPIDANLDNLEVFYRAGLRSLGLVWSRSNAFGHGVPFLFHHSPNTGPGLTEAGKELVRACNRLGIMVDLAHLNEQGFWDVASISTAPLVASHSNVHALSPTSRNLTDHQLDAIRDSDGLVGLNFAVYFLREDGAAEADTAIDVMVRHIDYLVDRIGIERVGFGSDFDGALIPAAIGDASGLPRLIDALRRAGYDDDALAMLAHRNWIRVLRATWGG